MQGVYLQITTTTDSRAEAERLGQVMVRRRLAACAQIGGPISSTYWWKGSVETAEEWVAVMKTTEQQSALLIAAIKAEHSYETPDIVAISIVDGLADYLNWITEETQTRTEATLEVSRPRVERLGPRPRSRGPRSPRA